MTLVVFLRGVNVGGYKTFRPSLLAKELAEFDVVNIGAAGTFVVRKPISQANIVVGQIGVARSSPDYFAIQLMNHILGGGGFTSRLMRIIRTEGGLAYSVDSSFASTRLPGPFQIVLQTPAGPLVKWINPSLSRRKPSANSVRIAL